MATDVSARTSDPVEEIRRRRQLPEQGRRWTDRDIDALLEESEALATDLFDLQDALERMSRPRQFWPATT